MNTLDTLMAYIDHATEPCFMSKVDALDFLKNLQADISQRMEVLREEILNEEGGA